jgi:pimeloyl-ACP methyl ester carboxylesterase
LGTIGGQVFERRTIEVDGGALTVGMSGPARDRARAVVLAVHGITASLVSWSAVARALAADLALIAVDLRGRGASGPLPGPYGMRTHVADMQRVLDALDVGEVVAAGHSMGAYVAALLAAEHPDRVRSLVLVDGGFPLTPPPGIPAEEVVAAVVGPAVARLSMTFTDREEYHAFWRAHPAFARPGAWNDDVAAYLDYDLGGMPPELRSRVSADAVQTDGLELLTGDDVARAVTRVRCPIEIVRVERGLLDEPNPMVPMAIIAEMVHGPHTVTTVPDLNHYTLVFDSGGAAAVAAAIERASASPP